jgi:hypothetical protein
MVHSTGLNNYSPKSKAHLEVKVSGKRWWNFSHALDRIVAAL